MLKWEKNGGRGNWVSDCGRFTIWPIYEHGWSKKIVGVALRDKMCEIGGDFGSVADAKYAAKRAVA